MMICPIKSFSQRRLPIATRTFLGQSARQLKSPIVVERATFRNYSSTVKEKEQFSKSGKKAKSFTGHYIGLGLFTVTASGLVFSEKFRNSATEQVLTTERVGVVTVTLLKCIWMYSRTLNANDNSEEEYRKALSTTHKAAAELTLKALQKNGGIYIKLGQHIGAMTYLLPFEWTETMVPLQAACPESSLDDIKSMFASDFGIDLDDYFSSFDPKPIGVASLAQVHVATLRSTGEKVAIKFQHPTLDRYVPLDVALTKLVFDMIYRVFPQYPLTWLSDELQESIYVELDFRNEANNAQITDKYFKPYQKLTALRIPQIYRAERRILIMEYVGGARLDDLDYLDQHGISRSEVSCCLSHIFNNMIFQSGFVHCDPHHGNLAIRALDRKVKGHNFEIILYDHGLYRVIPQEMKVDYSRFWLALINKQQDQMKKYGTRFAKISDDQFPILAAALTGRDFDHALEGDVQSVRDEKEIEKMRESLVENDLIFDLMSLLASVPRIVLLILKTNDLTRHLDESLKNPLGAERTFLILAGYCAKTVYDDDVTINSKQRKHWSIDWIKGYFTAYANYYKITLKLAVYDLMLYVYNLRKAVSV
ncbi:hypothetical protein CANARDRAFT_25896 [[Candida] arabinofermentans NRRL YB-2248]|uniref:ABC1 atypical kinase-like domain-containing protein n=1 Tax=[Candida] arabinofermentans NRRL YB-2248 TaxID=983967 RepID=A0A1E4T7A9_9ASCO|nr:hypothetical protein CANARDRAFT_25896 [[Candida] arabinofermentans NRRL YB-2248]